jgi:ADP-ribose pyrophosphatase YjhB (NUDIX family)
MTDITFDLEGYRINLRVAAVLTSGKDILVCRVRTENWWFLPGGRIKANESSIEAIARELHEEIGDQFRIHRPMVCAESFFDLNGVSFHEICTYYKAEWLRDRLISQPEAASDVVAWMPRTEVRTLDLRPAFIKRFILHPPPHLVLVVHREGQRTASERVL